MSSSLKIVLLGDSAVGKSSLVIRFVEDVFDHFQPSTVGAAFLTKTIHVEGKELKLEIWDTAGQERYRSLAPMYYRNAAAAIVMFDLTNKSSLLAASTWMDELRQKGEDQMAIALVGNKSDLSKDVQVTEEEAQAFLSDSGAAFYMRTSAKTGENVQNVFQKLGEEALRRDSKEKKDPDQSLVDLISDLDSSKRRKCC